MSRIQGPAPAFELGARDGEARRGRLRYRARHGRDAGLHAGRHAGTVKSLTPADLREIGTEIVLANTYHLFLRPGHTLIAELGGLHRFMAWDGPILTDSGGYQVWSLAALRTIREEGVRFRSHLDGGTEHLLTPELVVEIQHALGVDVLHPLDECLPHPATAEAAEESLGRTVRWARRAHAAHVAGRRPGQACFGIVQGGMYPALRRAAVAETCALGFDGYALGGFAVGEPRGPHAGAGRADRAGATGRAPALPDGGRPAGRSGGRGGGRGGHVRLRACRPGTRGPARPSRAGGLLVIRNATHARAPEPLGPGCPCYTCRHFSRAYLRHLFLARELTVYRLLTLHNLTYYLGLMAGLRAAISAGTFAAFRRAVLEAYGSDDAEPVTAPGSAPPGQEEAS